MLREQSGIRTATRAVPVALTDERLGEFPLLYMAGHYDPALTPAEKGALRSYLERGGFLFAEACCGMRGFDEGFRDLMGELFPEAPLERIPPASPMLNGQAGPEIEQVTYSRRVQREQPDLKTPHLEGVELGGRFGVVYSPYAVAPGLDGIMPYHARSYVPEDARRVVRNVFLYALRF